MMERIQPLLDAKKQKRHALKRDASANENPPLSCDGFAPLPLHKFTHYHFTTLFVIQCLNSVLHCLNPLRRIRRQQSPRKSKGHQRPITYPICGGPADRELSANIIPTRKLEIAHLGQPALLLRHRPQHPFDDGSVPDLARMPHNPALLNAGAIRVLNTRPELTHLLPDEW